MTLQIADHWFELKSIGDGITLMWEPHVVPFLRCNIWHVRGRDRDLIIDTGMGVASLRDFARDILDRPASAVATHAHLDHIGGHHEFDHCIVPRLEAAGLDQALGDVTLVGEGFDPMELATLGIPPMADYSLEGPMLTAIPHRSYDVQQYRIKPARNLTLVDEGDVIDLGDRQFEVFHLPGHSPGSIGLFERTSGILFSGDAVYDGDLLDTLHHSNVDDYIKTIERLRDLPVTVVHAGHEQSFGRDRLRTLAEGQLGRWSAE